MTEPYVCPQCGPDDRGGDVHTAMAHTVEGLLSGQTSAVQDRPEVAYQHDRVTVWSGDCLDVLRQLDGASVDAVVCDPPYGLEFMGKDWDRPWAVGMSTPGYADADRLERPTYGDNRNPTCDVCGGRARGANRCTCPEPTWKPTGGTSARPEPATRWAGLPFQQWVQAWAAECLRVLKPGGHLLAFGGTRTYHRLTSGIEDAGFEVRDTIMWLYGQGFPKSLNVSAAIDKAAGAERPVIGTRTLTGTARIVGGQGGATSGRADELYATKELRDTLDLTGPATDDARTWEGWGTALKPSHEPIVVARKPFTRTVADNVLTYGTGALNIDGTRSPMSDADAALIDGKHAGMDPATYERTPGASLRLSTDPMPLQPAKAHAAGRWPSNVVLTHAQACTRAGTTTEVVGGGENGSSGFVDGYAPGAGFVGREVTVDVWDCAPGCPVRALDEQTGATASRPFGSTGYADNGSVSRYFTAAEWETGDPQLPTPGAYYVAKATTRERPAYARDDADGSVSNTPKLSGRQCRVCGNRTVPPGGSPWPACGHEDWEPFETENAGRGKVAHPTVKPVALMRHLVRLVTPAGGVVLDPFAGSGTTGEAALLEGMRSVLIEREPDYLPLIAQRLDRHLDAAAWLRSTGQADGTLFG